MSSSTSSSSASLPWSSINFGGKIFSSQNDSDCFLSWACKEGRFHLDISSRHLGILDLRVDREITWMEVRKKSHSELFTMNLYLIILSAPESFRGLGYKTY